MTIALRVKTLQHGLGVVPHEVVQGEHTIHLAGLLGMRLNRDHVSMAMVMMQ
jgi:hypothetical protein